MTSADERLREAALRWAAAHRARVAASGLKRRTFAAARDAYRFGPEKGRDHDAAERLSEARAELRRATAALLALIDPKPLVISAKAREIRRAQSLLPAKTGPPG